MAANEHCCGASVRSIKAAILKVLIRAQLTMIVMAMMLKMMFVICFASAAGDSYNFMETRGVVFGAVDMSALNANRQLVDSNGQQVLENRLDSELVWRTCIIVKAGTSRLLIACLIILLIVLAGWIWASSPAVTEKDHQVAAFSSSIEILLLFLDCNLYSTSFRKFVRKFPLHTIAMLLTKIVKKQEVVQSRLFFSGPLWTTPLVI